MCNFSDKKCIIVEATEVNTAVIVILHEMGHSLGLPHDEETECISNPGFMTSSLEMKYIKTNLLQWSSCSQKKIAAAFDAKNYSCLMKDGARIDLLKENTYTTTNLLRLKEC